MHSKQWHYSLHRDFQNCYSTRRSPTGFFKLQLQLQLQFYKGTRTPSIHIHLHVHIQRILHSEIQFYIQKTELFEYYYYTTDSSSLSRHSSLSSLSRHSSRSRHSRDIPGIPVIHDLPASPGNSSNSTLIQYLQGFHPIPAFSD